MANHAVSVWFAIFIRNIMFLIVDNQPYSCYTEYNVIIFRKLCEKYNIQIINRAV